MSKLVAALIAEKLITREQLEDAMARQAGAKKPLQDVLVDMGFVKEADLLRVASRVFAMPVVKLDDEQVDPELVKTVTYEMAQCHGVFPVRVKDGRLLLAMSDAQDIIAIDDIKLICGMPVRPLLATKSDIARYIEKYYQLDDHLYDILKNIERERKIEFGPAKPLEERLKELGSFTIGDRSPVVQLVSLIMGDAIKARASDIHIEPQEGHVEVRYRIDGDLRSIMHLPLKLLPYLAARIKVLADLDIAETRKAQDGRAQATIGDRKIDLRLSVLPTFYGERIAMRILDADEANIKLTKIGFEPEELTVFNDAIHRSQGIVLVTGPTGSGKTSTLYAALNHIKDEVTNIITIEDPIEYLIDGINQMQINPVKDVTFANGLRSILRQDPNVILVGEIRDADTAEIAFRSSLTGHLVFSTLHTNGTVASITRLVDIGLEPYLIASSLVLIVAQRLVRVICPHCKSEYVPSELTLARFRAQADISSIRHFYNGRGCEKCDFTGFLGRTAIFEILRITDRMRELIAKKTLETEIMREARTGGMRTLAEAGVLKVAEGLTTLEEVAKVIDFTDEAAATVPPGQLPAVDAKPEREVKPPTVLLADDDAELAPLVEKRLSAAGYRTIVVSDGAAALAAASRERPDIIIMDAMMPVMDGFEAIRSLRGRLATSHIPVIMLTAKKDTASELRGLDAGADDYITKPFDDAKLLARIKLLLRRK